jgi:hypothetical protein
MTESRVFERAKLLSADVFGSSLFSVGSRDSYLASGEVKHGDEVIG